MRSPFRRGRHSAATPASTVRGLVVSAAIFVVAIALAGTVTGGTYALWNNDVAMTGSTISTGSIGLTVDGSQQLALQGLDVARLAPGGTVITDRSLTLRNTGSTALRVSVAATTVTAPSATGLTAAQLSSSVLVSVRAASGSVCAVTGDTRPMPASMPPLDLPVGGTALVCVELRLAATAPSVLEKQTVALSIALTGDQLRPGQ